MNAFGHTRYGSPGVLELKEVDKPVPGVEKYWSRLKFALVNAYDWNYLTADIRLIRVSGGGFFRPKNARSHPRRRWHQSRPIRLLRKQRPCQYGRHCPSWSTQCREGSAAAKGFDQRGIGLSGDVRSVKSPNSLVPMSLPFVVLSKWIRRAGLG